MLRRYTYHTPLVLLIRGSDTDQITSGIDDLQSEVLHLRALRAVHMFTV